MKNYEVYGTILVSFKYDIEAHTKDEAIQIASDFFAAEKNVIVSDSSTIAKVISMNGGIDDSIEFEENGRNEDDFVSVKYMTKNPHEFKVCKVCGTLNFIENENCSNYKCNDTFFTQDISTVQAKIEELFTWFVSRGVDISDVTEMKIKGR